MGVGIYFGTICVFLVGKLDKLFKVSDKIILYKVYVTDLFMVTFPVDFIYTIILLIMVMKSLHFIKEIQSLSHIKQYNNWLISRQTYAFIYLQLGF